jgi:formamidopyrimidine-DNA glycosylase
LPELPEVETVARGLRAHLPGRRIVSVQLGKTDFIDDPAALESALPGSRFAEVRRHGKLMALRLEPAPAAINGPRESFYLLIHLGMTGQVLVCAPDQPVAPHTHVFLALDDGREVRYTDPRRFGRMRVERESSMPGILTKLGLEPLEMSEAEFTARIAGRRAMIKALLLNQAVVRGLGNIYTDESLYRARIHPKRIAAKLGKAELRALYRAIRKILETAIRLGGSSISDYVDSAGNPGSFQLRHQAYGREGKGCRRCGTKIRRVIVAGRSSYFCPHCQAAPRRRKKGVENRKPVHSRILEVQRRAAAQRKSKSAAPRAVHPAA